MGDFKLLNYCRQLRCFKPLPPYDCPIADCKQVFSSMSGFKYHLTQHSSHKSPLGKSATKIADNTSVTNKAKRRKNKERRITSRKLPKPAQLETENLVTSMHLSKTLCEVEVANKKVIYFNAEDHLRLISKDELLKQNKHFKIPYKTTEILASLSKSQKEIKKLPQAAFKKVNDYDIPKAPPMPNSYIRFIEKTEKDFYDEVSYDMDEEDNAWLQIMNERREKLGLENISIDSFELLMDRLEKECYFLVKMNRDVDSSLAVIDDEAVCAVCLDSECQNSNVILFCDMCNIAVHQDCYGVPYIPEGQWLCRRCLHSPSCMVDCALCPNKCGAFKQTDRGLWVHVLCALWIPEVVFANTMFLEPIESVETIPTDRWNLKCYICKQCHVGACIQCHDTNCYTAFHATCAQQAGLYMKIEEIISCGGSSNRDPEPGKVIVQKIAFCGKHSPADKNCGQQSAKEKLYNARRVLAKKCSQAPVISIPKIPPEKIKEITNLLSTPLKYEFVQRLIAYWTLKRNFRNGVPLLQCLQFRKITREVSIGNEYYLRETKHQFNYLKVLRHDLERVRLLCELVIKRERLKKDSIKMHEQYTLKLLWPLNTILHTMLQQLIAIDTDQIFIKPDQNGVPVCEDVVNHPMNLLTMEIKIINSEYNTFDAFENDFNLMVSNCLEYNSKKTIFYKAGIKMRDQGVMVLRDAKKDLKTLEVDPVSMKFAQNTLEVEDEFDHKLKKICNPSNTVGNDDGIYQWFSTGEAKNINESEKVYIERTSLKGNDKKNNKETNECLVIKKPETMKKSVLPLIRLARQSTDLERFKTYRSRMKSNTDSLSDEESSYLTFDGNSYYSSSENSGSESFSDSNSSSTSLSESELEKEPNERGKTEEYPLLQLVWAKRKGYPWYPALIIDPNIPPGYLYNGIPVPSPPSDIYNLASNYKKPVYLAMFFDSKRTWKWLPRNKFEPLGFTQEMDDIKLFKSKNPEDRKSIRKAYMEVLVYKTDPIIPFSNSSGPSKT